MKVLDSKRLCYQLMGQNDGELLFKLNQNPDVMRFINGGKSEPIDEINTIYLPRLKKFTHKDNGWGLWKISKKKNNTFIGWILVRPMNFFTDNPQLNNIEIGWRFFKSTWGNGYATEAAQNIVDVLSQTENIHYISAVTLADNLMSISIMKKLGMSFIEKNEYKELQDKHFTVYYQMTVK